MSTTQTNATPAFDAGQTNTSFANSVLAEAYANELKGAQRNVSDWNNVLRTNYLTQFENWAESVRDGRSSNANPPHPPTGYVLGYFRDSTTGPGSLGPYGDTPINWPAPVMGTDPVCDMPAIPAIPGSANPKPVPEAAHVIGVPADDPVPVNTEMTDATGQRWVKKRGTSPFGTVAWWERIAALLLVCLFASASAGYGQVNIKFTPEGMAVPTAQIANARDLGRWLIEGCNDGTAPAVLTTERLSLAAEKVRFVDTDDATLVLTARARKTFWGYLEQYGPLALQAVALTKAYQGSQSVDQSRANARWAAGLSAGSYFLPGVIDMAHGQAQTPAPLLKVLQYPLTVAPGGCFTDHRFASRMRDPQPFKVTIQR